MTSQLFRQEAIDALARTQLGEVRLGLPIRLAHAILTLLFLLLVATWYVGGSSYTRKYPVEGAFDENNAKQLVSRDFGELTELAVAEGDRVDRGDYLGRIVFDTNVEAIKVELERQMRELEAVVQMTRSHYSQEKQRLAKNKRHIQNLLKLAVNDIRLQKSKVSSLKIQLQRTGQLREQGYLSNLDWLSFQTSLITEQQNLNNHRQRGVQLRQQLDEVQSRSISLGHQHEQSLAEVEIQLAQLRSRLHEQSQRHNQPLRAPVTGHITRIELTPGSPVRPGMPVLHISSSVASFTGTLSIPTHAAGFVQVGQQLDLEIDAFPADRHGRIQATITQLSDHTIMQKTGIEAYVARLTVNSSSLKRDDSGRYLPGMGFRAFIAIQNKTLFEWALGPIRRLLETS